MKIYLIRKKKLLVGIDVNGVDLHGTDLKEKRLLIHDMTLEGQR